MTVIRLLLLLLVALLVGCDAVNDGSTRNTDRVEGSVGADTKKGTWYKVAQVTGTGKKTTETFKISGSEWKISWKTTAAKGKADEFIVILNDKQNPDLYEIIVNVTGTDEDLVFLEGKGQYYLTVTTTQQYSIDIQELR